MSQTIESLWPSQIRQRVLSPIAILRAQGEALARQTGGILLGEINKEVVDETVVSLAFNIIVPALSNYRHRVLDVLHAIDLPYPAIVDAEITRPGSLRLIEELRRSGRMEISNILRYTGRADSEQELIDLVENVLKSPQIVSAAQSLLARASDVLSDEQYQPDGRSASSEAPLTTDTIANHKETS
jgi:hypothetical protein